MSEYQRPLIQQRFQKYDDFLQWCNEFDDELIDRRGTIKEVTKQQAQHFFNEGMTPQEAVTKLIEDLET